MINFAKWKIKDEEYKLKLKTSSIVELESKLGRSLLDVLVSMDKNMPQLSLMLDITFYAMKDWNSGIKRSDMEELFDKYIDNGGTITDFLTDVFTKIYEVSGFFTEVKEQKLKKK